jgi:hypothetical protein
MIEAVPVFERWGWNMQNIEEMDLWEWYDVADIVEALNTRDAKIAAQRAGGK